LLLDALKNLRRKKENPTFSFPLRSVVFNGGWGGDCLGLVDGRRKGEVGEVVWSVKMVTEVETGDR
jgi:hypothetical protein